MNEEETEGSVLSRSTREVHLAPIDGSSHSQVRVKRGFILTISSGLPRWEVNQYIDRARIASLAQSRDPRIVFVGTSSLCVQGVPLWSANHDITFWCPQPYPNSTLPSVRYSGFTIPPVKVRKLRRPPLTDHRLTENGVHVEDKLDAALRLAMGSQHFEAFVAMCMTLHTESDFSLQRIGDSRKRENNLREELTRRLSIAQENGWKYGISTAKLIVKNADAGCDNPAEAAILYAIRSIYSGPVLTQFEINGSTGRYFIDFTLPEKRVAIEFDGMSKLGSTNEDLYRAKQRWIRREQDLRDCGWNVIRYSWEQLKNLPRLQIDLAQRLDLLEAIPTTSSQLWDKGYID